MLLGNVYKLSHAQHYVTSQEFAFKSWFYYKKGCKNAKIAENLYNFGKNGFNFLILVVKYKFDIIHSLFPKA